MRRKDRQTSTSEAKEILARATWGVLSMCSEQVPYGVPVNYVYSPEENAVFFHCALHGKKNDIIALNPRVSLAVVAREKIIPENLTTLYESVIATGTATVIDNQHEKIKRLKQLCDALAPGAPGGGKFAENCVSAAAMVRIDLDEITGKKNA